MGIQRLNHAVLYVRDVAATAAFYRAVLGFTTALEVPGGAFLRTPGSSNDHDIAFFEVGVGAAASPAGRGAVGLYHLAWEVDTLAELQRLAGALLEAGALVGSSDHGTTKALYCHDRDGIEFEVSWLVPADVVAAEGVGPVHPPQPLDLAAEIARYGADTRGGGTAADRATKG